MNITLIAIITAFAAGALTVIVAAVVADRVIRRRHGLHTDAQVRAAVATHEAKGGAR